MNMCNTSITETGKLESSSKKIDCVSAVSIPEEDVKSSECEEAQTSSPRSLYSEKVKYRTGFKNTSSKSCEPQATRQIMSTHSSSNLSLRAFVRDADVNNPSDKKVNEPATDKETIRMKNDTNVFVGVQRKRNHTKRFFISGIDEKVDAKVIFNYLSKRGIRVTLLNLFTTKRKGTVSAKLNIRQEDSEIILQKGFWSQFVACRPCRWQDHVEGKNEKS